MHIHLVRTSRLSFAAVLLAGSLTHAAAVTAASPCQGLAQDACSADSQCAWVSGYTRKDGRAVASHCRLKAARKTGEQARNDDVKLSEAR